MLVKIINGTFGHREGNRIVPKKPGDEPFEVALNVGERLIRLSVAVSVCEPQEMPAFASAETGGGTSNNDKMTNADDDLYNDKMTNVQLTAIANRLGITVPVAAAKKQILELLDSYKAGRDDDRAVQDDDEADNVDMLPSFNPAPPVE